MISFIPRREIGIVRRKLALNQSGVNHKSSTSFFDTDDDSEKDYSGEFEVLCKFYCFMMLIDSIYIWLTVTDVAQMIYILM